MGDHCRTWLVGATLLPGRPVGPTARGGTMFAIIIGVVVSVVLLAAWLVDRHWGIDPRTTPSPSRAQAESDAALTVYTSRGSGSSL